MHIFSRTVNGRPYRILQLSERVPGKAHPVSRQISLGPVTDDEPVDPSRCEVVGTKRVGDVAALIAVAEELGVLDAFETAVPTRGEGPSLGEMIMAVALQRVCAPGAKRDLPEFLDGCLPRHAVKPSVDFTGQVFHRVTRGVTPESYEEVQFAIARRACELYRLKTDVLAYDSTNFDTFIDTTTASELARRGHAKSKRSDLRVVGLALMTSSTGSVPLFHRTYAGSDNDKTVLSETLGALATLHGALGGANRTLVRDGGFAGEQLDLGLKEIGYRSVSVLALSTTVAREALTSAAGKMRKLPGKLCDVGAYRTRVTVGELDRTLVVVQSPEMLKGQLRGLRKATQVARKELRKIAKRLLVERSGKARGRCYTVTSLKRRVAKLTRREHVGEVLDIVIDGPEDAPTLVVSANVEGRRRLIRERLGKRVIVTDQHDWSTARIVRTFRSQWKVERAFRRMKRGAVSPWGPSYQWTDDSLRAHTFATVLGLQLATLAKLKLERAGIKRTTKGTMKLLAGICLTRVRVRSDGPGRPREILMPAQLDAEARKAAATFGIEQWSSVFSATSRSGGNPRLKRRAA
jgi:transposase